MSFCSLIKGISLKICMLSFFLINSVLLNLFCVWILSMNLQCLYRHGLFSCGSLELCKVWWLCLPLSCGCTRYAGCVCLCRAVVQSMVAVFAFVVRLYKVWWLCLPLSCGCTRCGGCVCLCDHCALAARSMMFRSRSVQRMPVIA